MDDITFFREEKEFDNFQKKVKENHDIYKEEIINLKNVFSEKKKSSRQQQLKKIKELGNFPTFLRLYVLSSKNLPPSPLHFDEDDEKEISPVARFLNIIANEDDEILRKDVKENRISHNVYKEYTTLRLQLDEELKYKKTDLGTFELKLIIDFQSALDESRKAQNFI